MEELETTVAALHARVTALEEQACRRAEDLHRWVHDLRTPLTYLVGYSELLIERDLSLEKMKQMAGEIHHQATQLDTLINQLDAQER